MLTRTDIQRIAALALAVIGETTEPEPCRHCHRTTTDKADQFLTWLTQPPPIVAARLIAGTPTDRNQPEGPPVSLVMPDNDKVTISVAALDVENVAVADDFTDPNGPYVAPFTWAVDNTALGELTVAPDTLSVELMSVIGQAGTVAVVATDVNGKATPAFTVEIDPSAAVTAGLVAGTPVPRDAAPAETPAP